MKASDWISVKDRLPLDGDCILVAYPPQSYAAIGNVYFGDNQFYREVDGTWLKGVTHWQKIVLPKKEKK
jgi:hypothetical protein